LSKQAEHLGSLLQGAPPRSLGLESAQNHAISCIAQPLRQMVQHTPASDHPACGNDDAWRLYIVDLLRILHASRQVEFMHAQRVPAVLLVPRKLRVMVFLILQVKIRGTQRHGAVDIHGYRSEEHTSELQS